MSIVFDNEMMKALEADGEKLRALTGEEHRPYFLADGEPVPADIRKTAKEVVLELLGSKLEDWQMEASIAFVAAPILAERKRCAEKADEMGLWYRKREYACRAKGAEAAAMAIRGEV